MRTTARIAAIGMPVLLASLAPAVFGQAKETKAQRLESLRTVLTQENTTIAALASLKANTAGPHEAELAALIKSRDAVQRLVNAIEGKDEEAGIAAHHKRDAATEKGAAATDYYATIKAVHTQVEADYVALDKDPGKNNASLKNAVKFLDEVRGPVGKEVAVYEAAHPNVVAAAPLAPATPAPAAPMPPAAAAPVAPATPAPATPAPATPSAVNPNDPRIPELQKIIPHLDHSIDYVTSQPTSDPLRAQTLAATIKARDSVRQLLDELTGGDAAKDLASDHARDTATQTKKMPDYYTGLVEVGEYLNNDHILITKQADDAQHFHATAVSSMELAYNLIYQQTQAYKKAHPNVK